jgi:hypothetical protein
LLATSERQDAGENNLRCSAYEALNTTLTNAAEDTRAQVEQLLPVILKRLEVGARTRTARAASQQLFLTARGVGRVPFAGHFHDADRVQRRPRGADRAAGASLWHAAGAPQGAWSRRVTWRARRAVCRIVSCERRENATPRPQVITQKLGPASAPYADRMMQTFLQVFGAKNSTVQEEALMAVGAVATGASCTQDVALRRVVARRPHARTHFEAAAAPLRNQTSSEQGL